jgi:hypothetical protein
MSSFAITRAGENTSRRKWINVCSARNSKARIGVRDPSRPSRLCVGSQLPDNMEVKRSGVTGPTVKARGGGPDRNSRVSTLVTEKTWQEWLERLYTLRRDKRGSHERPHKPVLLLSILDLLDRGASASRYFEVVRERDDRPSGIRTKRQRGALRLVYALAKRRGNL